MKYRAKFLKSFRNPRNDALQLSKFAKQVIDLSKRCSRCEYCGFANGRVHYNANYANTVILVNISYLI